MPSTSRAGRAIAAAAAAALLLATAPSAMAATSTYSSSVSPNKLRVGQSFTMNLGFTLDPDAGKDPGTLSRVELLFPNFGKPMGHLFPSCSAEQIMARRGNWRICPKGSLIGRGTGRSDVPAVPVSNVPVWFTIFNGPGGKSTTLHVYATNPVLISEAFKLPITRIGGRFGYKVVADVPEILQEINGPGGGWFVGLRRANFRIGATTTSRGRRVGYFQVTRACPASGSVPVQASFDFRMDNPRSTADSTIKCRR